MLPYQQLGFWIRRRWGGSPPSNPDVRCPTCDSSRWRTRFARTIHAPPSPWRRVRGWCDLCGGVSQKITRRICDRFVHWPITQLHPLAPIEFPQMRSREMLSPQKLEKSSLYAVISCHATLRCAIRSRWAFVEGWYLGGAVSVPLVLSTTFHVGCQISLEPLMTTIVCRGEYMRSE